MNNLDYSNPLYDWQVRVNSFKAWMRLNALIISLILKSYTTMSPLRAAELEFRASSRMELATC